MEPNARRVAKSVRRCTPWGRPLALRVAPANEQVEKLAEAIQEATGEGVGLRGPGPQRRAAGG
jgi:hypothetical protein